MKVIYEVGRISKILLHSTKKSQLKNSVVAIGIFDGVHRGHQLLLKKAIKKARFLKTKAVVLTFFPHPVHVLYPKEKLEYICSLSYRLKLFEQIGIDYCLVIRFTRKFSSLTPEKFIKKYLVPYFDPKEIFVGNDFRFGQNRSGGVELFKEAGIKFGFKVNSISPVKKEGREKISSTHIRELISRGDLRTVKRFLTRPFAILGKVVKGHRRGKRLGYPTANINPKDQVLPPSGVYAVRVIYQGKKYLGMTNVGHRPSFVKNAPINIEVNIFNFHKDLYEQEILLEFVKKIREEKTFPSSEALTAQLKQDEIRVKKILSS